MKWILIGIILLIMLPLIACDATSNYDTGYDVGYQDGFNKGHFEAFSEGCHVGYARGYKEARTGLSPSMDWFFEDYPQYR